MPYEHVSRVAASRKPPLLLVALAAAALSLADVAAQEAGKVGEGGRYPLAATAHPPLPGTLSLYWFVPDGGNLPAAGQPDAAAVSRLARGVQLVESKDYMGALPLLSPTGLSGSPLESYASYYTALAQIGMGRYDEALLVLSLLASRPLDGALRELVPLRLGDAALVLKMSERAEGALAELTEEKLASPGAVWLQRARVEEGAGHTEHALASYRRLYYDFPLTDEASAAPEALARLAGTAVPTADLQARAAARAQQFFNARRWAEARTAFTMVVAGATGDAKEAAALRLAECDHFLGNRRAAKESLTRFFDSPTRGVEARFYYLMSVKALGDRVAFVQLAQKLAADYPGPWAEQALDELGGFLVANDRDDEADEVFRELLRRYPKSRYSERAAWKVGWRAYRAGKRADTVDVFESAASNFPRADTRPAWLYWAGRARQRLSDEAGAAARFRLVVADYQNSYYGRLATTILKSMGEPPVTARITATPPPATVSAVEPTGDIIRALVGAQMYTDAQREVGYAQRVNGDSPRLQATSAWISHHQGFTLTADERFAALRGAITTMRRAYPQFLAAGGEAVPPDVLRVIFPLDYWPLITKYADQYKLDRYLMAALMAQESTFTAEIRSFANAYGLMQIIPSTGRIYARKLGITPFSTAMLRQPEVNVQIGMRYFAELMERFGGAHFALASYNAGEGRVARWSAERPGVPQDEFIDDIPFRETQNYVKRILGTAEDYRYLYGSGLIDPNQVSGFPIMVASSKPVAVAAAPPPKPRAATPPKATSKSRRTRR